jgi:UDP-GlcNAc:undecaprenyl-phosphate GlcNAc-1-phosphate transferase
MQNSIAIYSLLSFLILFFIAKISYKLDLIDIPNNRKIHKSPTAYTAGLAISIILILSILLFNFSNKLGLILSMGFLISLVGFLDDKFNLNVGGKLSLQILTVFYLLIFEKISLVHLGDYGYFKLELGAFEIPFNLLCVLFLINSFNYFDGIDGMLSFTSISVLAILFFLNFDKNLELFILIVLIPIIFFLFFNFAMFQLPKMFLGDNGSLLLGFIISFTLIHISNQNLIHPILLAWSINIFVYEFLSLNLIRLKNKKIIFKAGNDHMHHLLLKKTKSVLLTNFYITSMNIVFFSLGYLSFLYVNPLCSLILFISLFIIFLIFRYKLSKNIN